MAAKKAKKTKKSKTAKKPVKKKVAARKAPAKKKATRTAKKSTPVRKAPAPKKATKAVKAKKKAPARKKKQGASAPQSAKRFASGRATPKNVGEGDYEASRAFDRDQAAFVKQNKAKIPAMGRQAKAALDGAEGASLRQAEAKARSHAAPDSEAEPSPSAWVIPPG